MHINLALIWIRHEKVHSERRIFFTALLRFHFYLFIFLLWVQSQATYILGRTARLNENVSLIYVVFFFFVWEVKLRLSSSTTILLLFHALKIYFSRTIFHTFCRKFWAKLDKIYSGWEKFFAGVYKFEWKITWKLWCIRLLKIFEWWL